MFIQESVEITQPDFIGADLEVRVSGKFPETCHLDTEIPKQAAQIIRLKFDPGAELRAANGPVHPATGV